MRTKFNNNNLLDLETLETIINNSQPKIKQTYLCCIYFLIKNKEIVYIGQTTKGIERIKTHTSNSKNKDFDSFYYTCCKEKDLLKLESAYITKYTPKYNRMIPMNLEYKTLNNIKARFNMTAWEVKKIIKKYNLEIIEHNVNKNYINAKSKYINMNEFKQCLIKENSGQGGVRIV
jgi:excinuclease UvrABC nuclease subunit